MEWWQWARECGFKFDPTDVQLISVYLHPKVRELGLRCDWIRKSNRVYKKPPWELCTDLPAFPGDEKYYLFTELEKNKNRVVRTVGTYGTWHGSSCKEIFGGSDCNNNNNNGIIGFKRLFNFKEKGEGKEMKTTDWLMHEFSLPGEENNLVLCVIQKKKKKKEMGSASAGRDPCPAPAPAHGDHPFSYRRDSAADLRDGVPDLPADDVSGFRNDVFISFPNDVPPGLPNYVIYDSNTSFRR